jgi:hypothetical protein
MEIRATPFVCPMFRRAPQGVVYKLVVVMPPASLSGLMMMQYMFPICTVPKCLHYLLVLSSLPSSSSSLLFILLFSPLYVYSVFKLKTDIRDIHTRHLYTIQSPQLFFFVFQGAIISPVLTGIAFEIATIN